MVGRGACLGVSLASGGETEGVPWRYEEGWKKKDASQTSQGLHHAPKALLCTLFLQTITDGSTNGPMGRGGKGLLGGGFESGQVFFKCPVTFFFLIGSHVLAEGDKNGWRWGVSANDVQSMGLEPGLAHMDVGARGRFELHGNHHTFIIQFKVGPAIDSFRMTFIPDAWARENAVAEEKAFKGLFMRRTPASEKMRGAM